MLELRIAFLIGVANVILLSYCARFWYGVWKEHDSPAAHAMTISCVFIVLVAAVGSYGTGRAILQNDDTMATISLVMSSFTFLYGTVQLMFTRGYFSKGEVT